MRQARLVVLALAAALVLGALAANAATPPTNECNGIRECQRARGPWVYVPAHVEVKYLLDCPRRRGIAAGIEALASSTDVHVWWDAQPGSPVQPGRTTTSYVLFHAVAGSRPGYFQPRLGCIPISPPSRSTTAVRVTIPGPIFMAATNLGLRAGTVGKTTIGCIPGQRLIDSWTAVAFRTEAMPRVALGEAVQVKKTLKGKKVSVAIAVSEALPPGSNAEVQLGVACAQS